MKNNSMWKPFTFCALCVLSFLTGCNESSTVPERLSAADSSAKISSGDISLLSLKNGQIVAIVPINSYKSWIESHLDITIDTMTSYCSNTNTSNPTSGFIIVYRTNPEKNQK